jgi:hypothetical protein
MHILVSNFAFKCINLYTYDEAQRHDFAKIADAAGYDRFVVVGESQTTVAALWWGWAVQVERS